MPRYERSHRTVVLASHLNNLVEIKNKCGRFQAPAPQDGSIGDSIEKRFLDAEIRNTETGLIEALSNTKRPLLPEAIMGNFGESVDYKITMDSPKFLFGLFWIIIKLMFFVFPLVFVIRTWIFSVYNIPIDKFQYAPGERFFMSMVDICILLGAMITTFVLLAVQDYRHELRVIKANQHS